MFILFSPNLSIITIPEYINPSFSLLIFLLSPFNLTIYLSIYLSTVKPNNFKQEIL